MGPYGDPPVQSSAPATLEELGFTWPEGIFSPTNIPLWLQEAVRASSSYDAKSDLRADHVIDWFLQNLSDLGMPSNAYDGIFIPMNTGMSGDIGVMPEAW